MRTFLAALVHSIRWRLIAGVVVLHAVLMGLVVLDMVGRQQRFMEVQLASNGRSLADALAANSASWVLSSDLAGLGELVAPLRGHNNVSGAFVLDDRGKVLASTDPTLINLVLVDPVSVKLLEDARAKGDSQSVHDGVIDSVSDVEVYGRAIGFVRVMIDAAPVQAELDEVVRKGVVYTMIAVGSGSLLAWLLVRTMTGRLASLSKAMDSVAGGRLDQRLPSGGGDDEVSHLIRNFNQMAAALAHDKSVHDRLVSKLDRANAELTRLAEVSAHHLQEPVRRLVTFSQQMRGALPQRSEAVSMPLEQIERDGRYLREMLRDIQRYLAAGAVGSSSTVCDANAAFSRACRRLNNEILETGAEIVIGFLPPAPIDSDHMADILTILLDNAIKYRRPQVPPRIAVSGSCDGGFTEYRVADNGIGVPAEMRERLFQVFERLHGPSVYSGTGIGLAIVRRIVESCDGKVWFEDGDGAGTVVVLRLASPDPDAALG